MFCSLQNKICLFFILCLEHPTVLFVQRNKAKTELRFHISALFTAQWSHRETVQRKTNYLSLSLPLLQSYESWCQWWEIEDGTLGRATDWIQTRAFRKWSHTSFYRVCLSCPLCLFLPPYCVCVCVCWTQYTLTVLADHLDVGAACLHNAADVPQLGPAAVCSHVGHPGCSPVACRTKTPTPTEYS